MWEPGMSPQPYPDRDEDIKKDEAKAKDEPIMFKLDGMTPFDVAMRISQWVKELGPYVRIDVDEEQVIIYKERVRICSDDD